MARNHAAEVAAETQFDVPLPKWTKRKRPEDDLQKAFIKYLRELGRLTKWQVRFIVAQPDSMGALSMGQIQHRIAMGILKNPGHPEVIVYDDRKGKREILFELKSKDGVLKKEQKEWQAWAFATGREYHVPRTIDECIKALG